MYYSIHFVLFFLKNDDFNFHMDLHSGCLHTQIILCKVTSNGREEIRKNWSKGIQ